MWTLTWSSRVCHHAAALARRSVLGELFRATPLGILLAALKSAPRQRIKR